MSATIRVFTTPFLLFLFFSTLTIGAEQRLLSDAALLDEQRTRLRDAEELSLHMDVLPGFVEGLYRLGMLEEANEWSDKMLKVVFADEQMTLEETSAVRTVAKVKRVITQFTVALDLYQQLLDFQLQRGSREAIANAYIDLAEFNRATFNHSLGLQYIEKANEAMKDTVWPPRLEARMLGRASALYSEGFPGDDEALRLSFRALEIAEQLDDQELIATSCNELGFLLNSEQSEAYYLRAIQIWSEQRSLIKEARVSLNLARYYMHAFRLEKGIQLAIEVLHKARVNNWSDIRWSATELLAGGFAKLGNWDSASVYTLRALQEATALQEERHSIELNEAMAKFEAIIAQNELVIQKQELQNANTELEAQSLRQKFMLTVVVGLAIGLLLFVLLYRKIQRVNQRIQTQQLLTAKVNDELKESLSQREMLMREIHHRVKNNLQIISSILNIQSKSVSDAVAQQALLKTRERVKAIALIHEKLYKTDDISKVDFRSYLLSLSEYVKGATLAEDMTVHVHIECERIFMDLDEAIPLGLIVNEAMVNTMKYAFKGRLSGKIWINYFLDGGEHAILQIRDDGVGMAADAGLKPSLGSKLIELLVRQLRGSLQVTTGDGVGINLRYALKQQD